MMAFAGASCTVNVLPFLATVVYATWHYSAAVAADAYQHFITFRFMYFRFKPESYYYGLLMLLRGALLCVVPVAAWKYPSVQVIVFVCLFIVFQSFQVFTLPWRSAAANVCDAVLSSMMVLLMACVAMSDDFHQDASAIGYLGIVIVSCMFATAVGAIGRAIYLRLSGHPRGDPRDK